MNQESSHALAVPGAELAALVERIRACRICRDTPQGVVLPHEPRPVLRVSATARLLIAGQAPGVRVHNSGLPFNDPSGDRLRGWMGVPREVFYDEARVAIAGMGFCFPGHDKAKGDLPPRKECRIVWHDALFADLPQIETILMIGRYALAYHFERLGLPYDKNAPLDDIIASWHDYVKTKPRVIPLPHPSWRNNGWLKRHLWFEEEVLPMLRKEVAKALR
ncbi:MAG TPA: uracil-DNA glycosylase family protein [Methylovirgula sp.]|nr:uracil-DNA glycosylase family protein [Methylovirgula sp.]